MTTKNRPRTLLALDRSHAHQDRAASGRPRVALNVAALCALSLAVPAAFADTTPTVTLGAGMRTTFDVDDPSSGDKKEDFSLTSARIYISGSVTDQISFMFNTEYNGSPPSGDNNVRVIDAAAQFHFSDSFNIWAGRFLPPSDRANMYGPYYANQFQVYNDGVQDGYPSTTTGRDDGVMYWGQFGMLKLSAGAFDIPSTLNNSNTVYAARAQLDLWDPEGGYYLNGTYYGEKDLLAFGVHGQTDDGNKAYGADFLLEKKLPSNGGVVSIESEYAKYDHFGGYAGDTSNGWYGLASYLFPQVVGIGKFQILAKYARAKYEFDASPIEDVQKTKDFELNYVIKAFNARVSVYYTDFTYSRQIVATDHKVYGVGLQLQM